MAQDGQQLFRCAAGGVFEVDFVVLQVGYQPWLSMKAWRRSIVGFSFA